MKLLFLWAATLLYVAQVGTLLWTGDRPGALILAGYVVANLGLIWSLS